jgi:hypothetical protein
MPGIRDTPGGSVAHDQHDGPAQGGKPAFSVRPFTARRLSVTAQAAEIRAANSVRVRPPGGAVHRSQRRMAEGERRG